MAAKIIDGVAISRKIREECRDRVESLKARAGLTPGLAVILVGENPASLVYIRNKLKACEEIGIRSYRFNFPASVDQAEVVRRIEVLNAGSRSARDFWFQLPLPPSF